MAETAYTADPKGLFSYLDFEDTEAGSGSGGDGSVIGFTSDPVAPPSNPSIATWGVNTITGTGWFWPAGGPAWQQIV